MLWIRSVAVATALFGNGFTKELVPNDILGAELYESGIMMERIMMKKEVCSWHSRFKLWREITRLTARQTKWDQQRRAGLFASERYPDIDTVVKCVNGLATAIPGNASYTFRCNNVRSPQPSPLLLSLPSFSSLSSLPTHKELDRSLQLQIPRLPRLQNR